MPDNDTQKDKMLDDLLDRSLAQYSNVEPRAGLENRILAGLASRDERSWRWNWKWVSAFAAACLVIALFIVSREQRPKQVIATRPHGHTEPRSLASIRPPTAIPKPKSATIRSHKQSMPIAKPASAEQATVVAKQPVFPAPSPLSEQEKLLFAYLRTTPQQELVQNSKQDEERIEPEINQVLPGQGKSPDKNSNSR
jgi:hypothetical protein